jgi:hypothetical protein
MNVRILKQSDILKCPYCIMMPEHYNQDGTCRCTDPTHTEMKEWGYKWDKTLLRWRGKGERSPKNGQ